MDNKGRFDVGDTVYYAEAESVHKHIICPDCAGKKYLTVILGDGEQVTIDCVTCKRGYEPSMGVISTWEYKGMVKQSIVAGLEVRGNKIEYLVDVSGDINGCYSCRRKEDVFATYEEAEKRVDVLVKQHQAEEQKRLMSKDKPRHSWAWNATYHRREMKRSLKDAEYHKMKIEVAKQHSKEKEVEA